MGNQNPKVELTLGQKLKLKLLRDEPITGKQTNGSPWRLYPVKDDSGKELTFFATDDIHKIIAEQKLKSGDEFILSCVQNGKPGTTKLEISIIGKPEKEDAPARADNLAEILKQSIADAAQAIRSFPDIPFQSEDIRAASLTIFIQRARNA